MVVVADRIAFPGTGSARYGPLAVAAEAAEAGAGDVAPATAPIRAAGAAAAAAAAVAGEAEREEATFAAAVVDDFCVVAAFLSAPAPPRRCCCCCCSSILRRRLLDNRGSSAGQRENSRAFAFVAGGVSPFASSATKREASGDATAWHSARRPFFARRAIPPETADEASDAPATHPRRPPRWRRVGRVGFGVGDALMRVWRAGGAALPRASECTPREARRFSARRTFFRFCAPRLFCAVDEIENL